LWNSGLSFDEFKDVVGFPEWAEIDRKYGTANPTATPA
jgi:hypothetical protein